MPLDDSIPIHTSPHITPPHLLIRPPTHSFARPILGLEICPRHPSSQALKPAPIPLSSGGSWPWELRGHPLGGSHLNPYRSDSIWVRS